MTIGASNRVKNLEVEVVSDFKWAELYAVVAEKTRGDFTLGSALSYRNGIVVLVLDAFAIHHLEQNVQD